MDEKIEITVLGCGSSSGVPVIGCDCPVCAGGDPRNNRTRTSCHVKIGDVSIIIDTGTDFRFQVLREGIRDLDAILYTHPHADHLNGIDDIRAFCFRQKRAIQVYGNAFTMNNMLDRFGYAFEKPNDKWNKPVLNANFLDDGPFEVGGYPMEMFQLPHGRWKSACYRIGRMAWLTDVNFVSDEAIAKLGGLDYLFIDCLMPRSYPSHLSHEEAFEYAKRIGAKTTYLIHMTHHFGYEELGAMCPENVKVAYDGLKLETGF